MRHDNGNVVSGYIAREIEPALQRQTIGCLEADIAAHEHPVVPWLWSFRRY